MRQGRGKSVLCGRKTADFRRPERSADTFKRRRGAKVSDEDDDTGTHTQKPSPPSPKGRRCGFDWISRPPVLDAGPPLWVADAGICLALLEASQFACAYFTVKYCSKLLHVRVIYIFEFFPLILVLFGNSIKPRNLDIARSHTNRDNVTTTAWQSIEALCRWSMARKWLHRSSRDGCRLFFSNHPKINSFEINTNYLMNEDRRLK